MKKASQNSDSIIMTQTLLDIQLARENILNTVNSCFDNLITRLKVPDNVANLSDKSNAAYGGYALPIAINPTIFTNKKAVAVVFGEERVYVKTWREVVSEILSRCCQNPIYYERLMALRGKVAGNVRTLLSDKPEGMIKPAFISNDLYMEVNLGAQAMMAVLVGKLLTPIGYDYSNLFVEVR